MLADVGANSMEEISGGTNDEANHNNDENSSSPQIPFLSVTDAEEEDMLIDVGGNSDEEVSVGTNDAVNQDNDAMNKDSYLVEDGINHVDSPSVMDSRALGKFVCVPCQLSFR